MLREYKKLTGREAADDGRFPYLEGVDVWRFIRAQHDFISLLHTTLKTGRALRGRKKEGDELWYARFRRVLRSRHMLRCMMVTTRCASSINPFPTPLEQHATSAIGKTGSCRYRTARGTSLTSLAVCKCAVSKGNA